MKKLYLIIMLGIGLSFSFVEKPAKPLLNNDKKGYIYIYLKWSDGSAATNIKVRLKECNGDRGDDYGFTDNNGYVKIYNYRMFYACGIFVRGDLYKRKMENGKTYTFYIK